jgi:hypothetical protein
MRNDRRSTRETMSRCEGYYRLENRRCDRESVAEARTADGDYAVCEYHRREAGPVARWQGETGIRILARPYLRLVA